MKPITRHIPLALLLVLLSGCLTTGNQTDYEKPLGLREQKAILAKARPLKQFGFLPSYPFGNGMMYIGGTKLQPDESALGTFPPDGMPIIEMDGKPFGRNLTVLLDTASNASWMQFESAKRNKATLLLLNGMTIPYLGNESTGGVNTYAGVVPLLKFDDIVLENTPFYIRMAKGRMHPVVYSKSVPSVDAVLGYDNLRQFKYIRFNMAKGEVRFSTSTPYLPNEKLLMDKVGISAICRDRLAVNGSIGGQPVPVVLDFVGDYAFARSDTREPVTKQVEFGDVVWRNVKTEVLTVQDRFPRAGRKMLDKYVVTVCPAEGVVYFERPAQ